MSTTKQRRHSALVRNSVKPRRRKGHSDTQKGKRHRQVSMKFWCSWDHSCDRLFNSFDLNFDNDIPVPNHHEPNSPMESGFRCPWGWVSVIFTSFSWISDLSESSASCKPDELQFWVMLEDLTQNQTDGVYDFADPRLFIRSWESPVGRRRIVLRSPIGTVEFGRSTTLSVLPILSITFCSFL